MLSKWPINLFVEGLHCLIRRDSLSCFIFWHFYKELLKYLLINHVHVDIVD